MEVWLLALGVSSVVSHPLEQPDPRLWALGLVHPSLAEKLRPPGPGRNERNHEELLKSEL